MRDRSLRRTIQSSHRWGNPGGNWRKKILTEIFQKKGRSRCGQRKKIVDSFVVQLMSLRSSCIGYAKNTLRAGVPMAMPPHLLFPKIESETILGQISCWKTLDRSQHPRKDGLIKIIGLWLGLTHTNHRNSANINFFPIWLGWSGGFHFCVIPEFLTISNRSYQFFRTAYYREF